MSVKRKKDPIQEKWYEEPVKKWFAIISGFIFVASLGYFFATIQLNLEFRMEKYELKQDFNEKLRNQIDECKEEKQKLENQRVEAIENVVKKIENKIDANK